MLLLALITLSTPMAENSYERSEQEHRKDSIMNRSDSWIFNYRSLLLPEDIIMEGDYIRWSNDAWTTVDNGSSLIGNKVGDYKVAR